MYANLMPGWNWSDQFYLKDSEGNVTENPDEAAITKYAYDLVAHAEAQLKEGRWESIDPANFDPFVDIDDDQCIKSFYLGSLINPSGKYYMPWTTNQTEADVNADMIFWEVLDEAAGKLDMWIESGEGDPTDTFIMIWADDEEGSE